MSDFPVSKSSLKKEKTKTYISLRRRGKMIVKKILSLLTLVLLLLFLIVSAFPGDGTDPDPDADPWNETSRREPLPEEEEASTIIIWVRTVPIPPYFMITFDKVSVSPSRQVTAGSKPTHSTSSASFAR